jgi:hypothetical protein
VRGTPGRAFLCLDSPPMSRSNALGDVMRREVVLYLASA